MNACSLEFKMFFSTSLQPKIEKCKIEIVDYLSSQSVSKSETKQYKTILTHFQNVLLFSASAALENRLLFRERQVIQSRHPNRAPNPFNSQSAYDFQSKLPIQETLYIYTRKNKTKKVNTFVAIEIKLTWEMQMIPFFRLSDQTRQIYQRHHLLLLVPLLRCSATAESK